MILTKTHPPPPPVEILFEENERENKGKNLNDVRVVGRQSKARGGVKKNR